MRVSPWIVIVATLVIGGTAPAAEAATLTATFTTSPNGGQFAPNNVVAVWVEGPGGTFVKTIGRWSQTRTASLVAWIAKAGLNDVDAVTGATRSNSTLPLTVTWNLMDKLNAVVPDGTYTIRMELADDNSTTPAQNHQGTFTFVKGPTAQMQTALTNGGFTNVSINFDPAGATTPPPVTNPPPSSGGGDAGTDESYSEIEGGCSTAGGGGGGLAMIALLGVLARRRRR